MTFYEHLVKNEFSFDVLIIFIVSFRVFKANEDDLYIFKITQRVTSIVILGTKTLLSTPISTRAR